MREAGLTILNAADRGGVLIPMVRAFQRTIGKKRADEIAREIIIELARKGGRPRRLRLTPGRASAC